MATQSIPARSASPADAKPWRDLYWWSNDGVRLHARVYGPAAADSKAVPLLCLPGLTRNARDFNRLAPALAENRPVYALSFRGRGDSGYVKDAMTYVPLTYVQDVVAMLAAESIDRFAFVGTSLGGIVGMLLAATQPGRIAAAVFNDVGPELDPRGLERIRSYVGQTGNFPTWVHAARAVAAANADVYPDWALEDWLVMVKRTHRLTREGRITADYDSNIAQPFRAPGGEAGVDLWPALAALEGFPVLVIRGALSDILPAAVVDRMIERVGWQAKSLTVANVGHAPTLDEPEAVAAIAALLADI